MKTTMALIFVGIAGVSACELSHGEQGNSSGSNWLRCQSLEDCGVPEAVACSEQGYCMDTSDARIAALSELPAPGVPGDLSRCAWGLEAILAEVGASAPNRKDCGTIDFSEPASDAAAADAKVCLDRARSGGVRAAGLTVNRCSVDCWVPETFVTTAGGHLYSVLQIDEAGASVREVRIKSCDALRLSPGVQHDDLSCENETELYHCIEPAMSASVQKQTTPIKLADAPNPDGKPTAPVHLSIRNQSFYAPWMEIVVRVDGTRVVIGSFTVVSQHNWLSFDIDVPLGSHRIDVEGSDAAYLGTGDEATLAQEIEISDERWLLLEYDYAQPDPSGAHFTLSEHDAPVSLP